MDEPMNIMIVDDNRDMADNLRDIMEEEGHTVFVAFDGKSAIELCRSRPFDLMLLDYKLPDMDGLQLQERLAETTDADYLIITVHASIESAAEAVFRKQIVGYETKPLDMGRLLAFVRQIGERRRAEEEKRLSEKRLWESEAKYCSIMEAMDDAVYICSSDYRIEYMNPAMIKMIGRDAVGGSCHKAIHGSDEKCPWCVHDKVMGGETVKNEVIDAKGEKTYDVSNVPIFHMNGSVSKLTVFRDVTANRKMESRLQQAEKISAIGTLAGGIAHDFNNILYPIIGYSEMIGDDMSADSPLRGFVDEILHAAFRARDLVKQILAFSRQVDREIMPIKLQPILKEALKLLRSTIPANIDIKQNIDSGCGVVVADPIQIHQIIMNLTTNAYHAVEETGGTLNVTLEQTRLDSDWSFFPDVVPGNYARLKVMDTGVGMAKDVLDKIFDPYFTTKENGKGTGLGLSVVMGIVKTCKGNIHIYSEPGQGTEVHVYLPLMERKTQKKGMDEHRPIRGGSERILLIDDEAPIVGMEQQVLERLGYRVTSRTGSIEALEAFKANPDNFDLVITDMAMPNMTGTQLAVEIRKIRPSIPVIICTGFSEQINEEKCRAMGIQGYVMKPMIRREMAEAIRSVLEG